MKSRLFIRTRTVITAGVLVAIGSPISRPIENSSIFNPANYSTIPPSSYQSYSNSSPIAFDSNGNLVITGNVRRGMHFRDTVPYESTTSFRGDLGSSSLNSFLRDSEVIDLPDPLSYCTETSTALRAVLCLFLQSINSPVFDTVRGRRGIRSNLF